jgi:transcriptional regulator with XRE-family HTH domain
MPAPTVPGFGILLRETRKREGLSQTQLADYLGISKSKVSKLESGANKPPADPAFYDRLENIRGFTVLDVARLRVVAAYDRSLEEGKKPQYHLIYNTLIAHVRTVLRRLETHKEKAQDVLTHLLPHDISSHASISLLEVLNNALKDVERPSHIQPDTGIPDAASQGVANESLQPSSQSEQRRRVRKKDVVFQRTRTHYDSVYLQENSEHVMGLVFEAATSNDPDLSPAAEQVLQSIHVVAESVVKRKGSSLSRVSREHHIPLTTLSRWVTLGLVRILYKDKKTTYLAQETATELGRIYQQAIESGAQPTTLLSELVNNK